MFDAIRTAKQADAKWAYWRSAVDGIVELGTLQGRDVGLPTHFHAEDQITFVVSGRRRFLIDGEVVELVAGQGALIAASNSHWPCRGTGIIVRVGPQHGVVVLSRSGSA